MNRAQLVICGGGTAAALVIVKDQLKSQVSLKSLSVLLTPSDGVNNSVQCLKVEYLMYSGSKENVTGSFRNRILRLAGGPYPKGTN